MPWCRTFSTTYFLTIVYCFKAIAFAQFALRAHFNVVILSRKVFISYKLHKSIENEWCECLESNSLSLQLTNGHSIKLSEASQRSVNERFFLIVFFIQAVINDLSILGWPLFNISMWFYAFYLDFSFILLNLAVRYGRVPKRSREISASDENADRDKRKRKSSHSNNLKKSQFLTFSQ